MGRKRKTPAKRNAGKKPGKRRPKLKPGMSLADFKNYYWLKEELVRLAKELGLPTHGYKPELAARIERRLRGKPDIASDKRPNSKGPRDSDRRLTRDTVVVNYKSDTKTREFFKAQIGPEFHFTYHVNQYRIANERNGLTYGDLIDEWIAERDRRRSPGYKAPIAAQGKYNRFIRDFFADKANQGKSLQDAVAAWNVIKKGKGDHRYRRRNAVKKKK